MLLSHWGKQALTHPQLPFISPLLHPHPGPWPPSAPTTEMSRQCRALQKEMEIHSRKLEEEVTGLREQLGRLPHPPKPFLSSELTRSSLQGSTEDGPSLEDCSLGSWTIFPTDCPTMEDWNRGFKMAKISTL